MVLPIALARPAAQAPHIRRRRPCRPATPTIASTPASTSPATSLRPTKRSPGATRPRVAADSLHFHLYYNAWRNDQSTWMRERRLADSLASAPVRYWRSIVDRHLERENRHRRRRARAGRPSALHRARRRQRGRSHGCGGPARRAGPARRQTIDVRSRGRRTCRAPSRAPARSATTSSSPSGSPSSACSQDARLELPSVPRRDGVLRRLRRLRRQADRAGGLDRRRHRRRARAPRQRRRHDDAPLLPGGRARLRVDDEPRLPRADRARSSTRRCRRSRCACCCSPSTRDRPSAISPRRATTLRYYGEWFGAYPYGHITIVDPAWQSGAGGMEYPTLFTAGTRWLAPRDVTTPRTSRSTKPATSSGTASSPPTSSRTRGWTRGSTPSRPRASSSRRSNRTTSSSGTSAGSCRGCFARLPLTRDVDGDRLAGYRRDARQDVQATPTFSLLARHRGGDHLQQDRAVAAHARAATSDGRRCSG